MSVYIWKNDKEMFGIGHILTILKKEFGRNLKITNGYRGSKTVNAVKTLKKEFVYSDIKIQVVGGKLEGTIGHLAGFEWIIGPDNYSNDYKIYINITLPDGTVKMING